MSIKAINLSAGILILQNDDTEKALSLANFPAAQNATELTTALQAWLDENCPGENLVAQVGSLTPLQYSIQTSGGG